MGSALMGSAMPIYHFLDQDFGQGQMGSALIMMLIMIVIMIMMIITATTITIIYNKWGQH